MQYFTVFTKKSKYISALTQFKFVLFKSHLYFTVGARDMVVGTTGPVLTILKRVVYREREFS